MPIKGKLAAELNRAHSSRYREAEDQLKAHLTNLVLAKNLIVEQEIDQRVGVRIKTPANIIGKIDRRRPRRVKSLQHLEHKVVTDIVGGRVILDYRDQVRNLCEDIKQCPHWEVVRNNRGRVHPFLTGIILLNGQVSTYKCRRKTISQQANLSTHYPCAIIFIGDSSCGTD